MLTFEQITQMNGKPDFIQLSEDGRWVVISYGDERRLLDSLTGQERGRIRSHGVISPDGNSLAGMTHGTLKVTRIDGKQVTKTYPHPTRNYPGSDACFTSDSRRLWATLWDDQGAGKLALLDADTLGEIAAVPLPVTEEDDETTWVEPFMSLHIPTDTLALQLMYSDGYHLLGVFFFNYHENHIRQHDRYISDSNLASMLGTSFSASGQFFAGIDGNLWVWRMADMKLIGRDHLWNVLDFDVEDLMPIDRFVGLTFIGEQLIVLIESESHYELRVVDFVNDKVLSSHPLPPDFVFPSYFAPASICGQTLVGMKGEDVVIYRLSLRESS